MSSVSLLRQAMTELMKAHRYISDRSEAPEGVDVKEGERGGIYYETDGTTSGSEPESPTDKSFPAALGDLKQVKYLGGSTGAVLTVDTNTGLKYVVKRGDSPEHIINEALANRAYRVLGVPTTPSKLYKGENGEPVQVAKYIDGESLDDVMESGDKQRMVAITQKMGKAFAAHALIANWDAAGLVYDNVIIGPDDTPIFIDNGGALEYRAQGKPKGEAFGTHVGEMQTLRNPSMNTTAMFHMHLSDEEIREQVQDLSEKEPKLLAAMPTKLRDKLHQRITDMREQVGLPPASQVDKARKYLHDPADAPEGYEAQQGERGGWYYETDPWDKPEDDPEKLRRQKFEKLTLRSYQPYDFDVDALHALDEALLDGLPDPPGETSWAKPLARKPSAYRVAGQQIQDQVETQRAAQLAKRLANDPYLEAQLAERIQLREESGLETSPERAQELKQHLVDSWIGAWTWSASEDPQGRLIQRAIEQAFSIKGAEPWRGLKRPFDIYGTPEQQAEKQRTIETKTDELWEKDGEFAVRFVKAMYDETQEFLAAHNITEVPLMRGLGLANEKGQVPEFDPDDDQMPGSMAEMDCLAGSCFTTSFDTANTYSVTVDHGATMFVKVPANRILSTFRTGFGQMKESEVVVIGGPLEGVIVPAQGREEVMPGTHYTKNNDDALRWAKEAGLRRRDLEMYVPADRGEW